MSDRNYQQKVWQTSAQHPQLAANCVHLWRANLDLPAARVNELAELLSTDEIAKANRFRYPHLKRRFIVARGVLRQLLANYLQISPKTIEFAYGDRGKPYLVDLNCLQFNLAHSHEYALYGFSGDYPLGVDLEYLREMPDAAKIAQRFFTPQEFQLINCLQGKQRSATFFKLWTAKEAYLKATGTGLSGSLSGIEIGFKETEPCLKSIQGNVEAVKWWSMYPCVPAQNYVGAIAIKVKIAPEQISHWHWS